MTFDRRAGARRQLLILALGAGGVAMATLAGRSDVLGNVFAPPLVARLLLGVAAALLALALGLRAADRIGPARGDARELIRAVRLVFLAVGALAASAGWFMGSPVPIVAALIIAGIDVLETTFLLLVTSATGDVVAPPATSASPATSAPSATGDVVAPPATSAPPATIARPETAGCPDAD